MNDRHMAADPGAPLLEMRGITKRFPGVVALDQVDFKIHPGEIVALIGENGAGKSTLMKILGGVHQPSAGELLIEGNPVQIGSVAEASAFGIGFVHQELNNLDNLDIAANVFLGREARKFFLLDRRTMRAATRPYLERLGLEISPDTLLSELSIGQQQMVEIAKALSMRARILIMDEPTSSLTLGETERLLSVMRELRDQGIAIIFISHRLGEIEQCADRVTALRDGVNSGRLARDEICHGAMVQLMVGRDVKATVARSGGERVPGYVQIRDMRTSAWPGQSVSLDIAGGEVLGVAGLVGAGRSELAQAIFGVERALSGTITLDGISIPTNRVKACVQNGIYLIPEDRKAAGLVVEMSVRENTTLASLPRYATAGLLLGGETAATETQIRELNIKTPHAETAAVNLSGGNQQKIVLGKWLSMNPRFIIFDEPTRGIDVGSKQEIYDIIHALADEGVAVMVISSDMEEVLAISDRIAVMSHGAISGFLERDAFGEEAVMNLAVMKPPSPSTL